MRVFTTTLDLTNPTQVLKTCIHYNTIQTYCTFMLIVNNSNIILLELELVRTNFTLLISECQCRQLLRFISAH